MLSTSDQKQPNDKRQNTAEGGNTIHSQRICLEQAEDNNVSLTEDELSKNKGVIIDLRSYLKTQKRIVAAAA